MAKFKHSAGGIILNSRGFVVLVQQRDGSWSFPKGAIESGEDPLQAATREIREECGLEVLHCVSFLQSYTRFSLTNSGKEDMRKVKHMSMYLFISDDVTLKPRDPHIIEAKWVDKKSVISMLSNPRDQQFFEDIYEQLSQAKDTIARSPVQKGFGIKLLDDPSAAMH